MGLPLKVSRVQRKGQVTIPAEIRQKLGLEEGDLVAFIETDAGILLSPQTLVPANTLNLGEERAQALDNAFDRVFDFTNQRREETAKPAGPPLQTGQSVAEVTFAAFPAAVDDPQEWRRLFIERLAKRTQEQSDQTDEA